MYSKDDKQLSLFAFGQSVGMELDPENRWVRMAEKVDWDKIEDKYCELYCPDNGAPGKPIRLAICALLISSYGRHLCPCQHHLSAGHQAV